MEPCTIAYIPSYLHTLQKPDINEFEVGEYIYRRCKKENVQNPFDSFSLYDISVNRQGLLGNLLSKPEDVLWNYAPDRNNFEKHDDEIISMKILELDENKNYVKHSDDTIHVTEKATLKLTHKKTPCNYAHCTFEVWFNTQEVTQDNYKLTIKNNSLLKTWCKNELSKMQIKSQIKTNW